MNRVRYFALSCWHCLCNFFWLSGDLGAIKAIDKCCGTELVSQKDREWPRAVACLRTESAKTSFGE
jgi:hypothetical protein